ncbi:hypothetical protein [Nocardia sp. NPDC057668]|uniref:hypothetical protein n=1 Tax=Nocardia sp. NPDC057668 TaxID=3346202 RepID=UPI003670A5EF
MLCAAALSVGSAGIGAAAPSEAGLGGCYRGNVLTGALVPGSGSAGQGVRRTAEVWDCVSPLLPGVVSGRFEAELPWVGFGSRSQARFIWSDGSVSTASGLPNTLWTIVDGPAAGHILRFQLAGNRDGDWYYLTGSAQIESLTFMR